VLMGKFTYKLSLFNVLDDVVQKLPLLAVRYYSSLPFK